jgi:hypothetical protein
MNDLCGFLSQIDMEIESIKVFTEYVLEKKEKEYYLSDNPILEFNSQIRRYAQKLRKEFNNWDPKNSLQKTKNLVKKIRYTTSEVRNKILEREYDSRSAIADLNLNIEGTIKDLERLLFKNEL